MIVVTGGAGFIGSAVVWGLNNQGVDDVLVVDELGTDDKWKNLVKLRFSDYINKADFIEELEAGTFGDTIEGIIHLGACSSTTEKDAEFLMHNNFEYTQRMALWSVENGKRLVYASSAATYGDGSRGFCDEHSSLTSLFPLNMYGYSKHLFDLWALKNGLLDKIAGLKYFNVFGPNEYHKDDMRSVVHKAFGQIVGTGKVKLFKSHRDDYEDGYQLRDFLYVKDAVDMTLFVYSTPSVNGIFNVGTGKARSFYDLVGATFSAMDRETNIEYIDMPEAIREKYQYFTEADIKKIRQAGYSGTIRPLEEAISDYVKNYLVKNDLYL